MRKEKYNKNIMEDIKKLELDREVNEILASNNINKVSDIWVLNRKKLKDMGIKDVDINVIIVRLQLLGLDLNKKVYSVE